MITVDFSPCPTSDPVGRSVDQQTDERRRQPPVGGPPVVLVATVRRHVVEAFRQMAAAVPFDLLVSPDALHAWMAAVQWAPTLMVLDGVVPGMTTAQLEAALSRHPRTSNIPRIFITERAVPQVVCDVGPVPPV